VQAAAAEVAGPLPTRIGDPMLKIIIPLTCLIFTIYIYIYVTQAEHF
jgi:hypothetical protein